MRYLAAKNPKHSPPIALVPMREEYDCLTCVTAMLLGIKYEEVEESFGGNLDPAKDPESEALRLQQAFFALLEKHGRSVIQLSTVPSLVEGILMPQESWFPLATSRTKRGCRRSC